jgi:hypothetical protein
MMLLANKPAFCCAQMLPIIFRENPEKGGMSEIASDETKKRL